MRTVSIVLIGLASIFLTSCQSNGTGKTTGGGMTGTLAGDDPTKVQVVKSAQENVEVSSTEATKAIVLSRLTELGQCTTLRELKPSFPSTGNAEILASIRDLESQGKVQSGFKQRDIVVKLPEHGAC